MSEETSTQPPQDPAGRDAPVLHYELEPRHRVFWSNLTDLIARREPPPLETTSQPVPVPPEKFIRTGLGVRHFLESYGYHIAFIGLVYFFSTSSLFNRPVELRSPFENTTVDHYPLRAYLRPIWIMPSRPSSEGSARPTPDVPPVIFSTSPARAPMDDGREGMI